MKTEKQIRNELKLLKKHEHDLQQEQNMAEHADAYEMYSTMLKRQRIHIWALVWVLSNS